ncbi:hypothetical protein OSB04_031559 [Centaurea solstitialis]|uniref:RanBP2-type domain-containing protein n=1 Tax=Centaurea solstitialis TaxID=347529 RepID=A0AA38SLX1_9ASTR|nr:hypothetical protein OSB04_031559 [Centaurea solstitialis]
MKTNYDRCLGKKRLLLQFFIWVPLLRIFWQVYKPFKLHSRKSPTPRLSYHLSFCYFASFPSLQDFSKKMSSGDWMCAACQHMNFKKRDACQRCHCPKFASSEEISSYGMNRTEVLAGDWYCATFNCGTHNYASRNACYRCGALKDYSAMMAASTASCYGYDASVVPGWKTGDWICNRLGCGVHNYASRMECYKCKSPRE